MKTTKPIEYIAQNIETIMQNGGGYVNTHYDQIRTLEEPIMCLSAKTIAASQTYLVLPMEQNEPYIMQQPRGYFESRSSDIAPTVTTSSFEHNAHVAEAPRYRIRKLTERECFRLMGVSDSDIDKIQAAGVSKTQQYKMAGNSIVVDVLAAIFKNLFVTTDPQPGTQTTLF